MKKILPLSLMVMSVLFVSCGKPNLDNIVVTPETPIENKNQSAKVCQPVMKYIECSLGKAAEEAKPKLQIAINNLQREIDNDDPVKVAQKCDSMIKVLQDKVAEASKNGCSIEAPNSAPSTETSKV